jgi:hypothetical protein
MATLVAPVPPRRLARTVLEEARPEVLARISEAGVAAVIWRRSRDPLLAGWIDALPPDRLPRLRGRVAARDLGAAVRDACAEAGLPFSLGRAALEADAGQLGLRFGEAMGISTLDARLEVVTTDACGRFHLDRVRARLLCAWRGPGCDYGPAIGPGQVSDVSRLPTGAAAILRGALWPNEATGLLHRSPPIEGTGATRLLLALDVRGDEDCACGDCR